MHNTIQRLLPTAALLLAAPLTSLLAQELPGTPDAIPTPELRAFHPAPPLVLDIKSASGEHTAPLLFIEDHSLPLVEGRLVFEAGTLREPAHLTGLGDLYTEALREGGCEDFTGTELNAWLDAHAVQLSFAMTKDHLRIEFSCLKEDLAGTLDRIGAILRAPSFAEPAVELARLQLLTSIARAKDDAAQLAEMAMNRILLGERTRFGQTATPESVASITAQDLAAFHGAHIGIDRLTLAMSGDVQASAATDLAQAAVAELPVCGTAPATDSPTFWVPDNTTIYVVDRPGVPQTELLFAGPGVRMTDKDHAALTLWTYVVGAGGMSNRMAQRVRTELGLAYGVGCGFGSGIARPGQFYAYCGTRNDAVAQAISEMMDVITLPNTEPVPEPELDAARARLLGGHVFRYDSASEQLDRALTLRLNGLAPDFWETNIQRMAKVTSEEVSNAALRLISPARFLCVAVGPADEIVAQLETVAKVVRFDELQQSSHTTATAQGRVDFMLAGLGGRELWRDLESTYLKKVIGKPGPFGTVSVPSEQWLVFATQDYRNDQRASNGLTSVTVIQGNKGWTRSISDFRELPAREINGRKSQMRRSLYWNLHRLAIGDPSLVFTVHENGELVLSENGSVLCSLSLDETGTPTTMTLFGGGAKETITFLEWTRSGTYPFVSEYENGGGGLIRVTDFTGNPALPEDHFAQKE